MARGVRRALTPHVVGTSCGDDVESSAAMRDDASVDANTCDACARCGARRLSRSDVSVVRRAATGLATVRLLYCTIFYDYYDYYGYYDYV